MIKQIGTERWYAMGQIYTIIPDILISLQFLASPFLSTQANSIDELSGEICFIFDTYETDFFVIPFLIELATQAFTTDEHKIIVSRLESIVWEQSSNNIEQWTQETVLQWLLKYVDALNARDSSVDIHDKDDAFGTTIEANFFTSPPPLILMKEHWEIMQDFLFDLFSREGNPFAQSHILLCLCRIFLYLYPGNPSLSPELGSLIERIAKDEIKHPLIRVVASLMHLRFLDAQVDESIIQILLASLRKDAIVNEWDVLFHANSASFRLIDHVGLTLRLLSPKMGSLILPSLLEILHHQEQVFLSPPLFYSIPEQGLFIELAHSLLYFAFGNSSLSQNDIPFLLTTTQRNVLTALLNSKIIATDALAKRFDLFNLPPPWKLKLLLHLDV